MFENLHWIVLNAAIVYIFILIGIRMLGKRELGSLSVADLVFIMLLSEVVGDVVRASNDTIMGGFIAALSLMILNKLFKLAVYKSKRFSVLVNGKPSVLLRDGKINERQMRKNRINNEELEQAARENGVSDLKDVRLAVLEKDGKVSILDDDNIRSSIPLDE